jgi:hypothetical protein
VQHVPVLRKNEFTRLPPCPPGNGGPMPVLGSAGPQQSTQIFGISYKAVAARVWCQLVQYAARTSCWRGCDTRAILAVLLTGSENHFLGPVITDTKLCRQCRGLQWLAAHRRGSGTKLVPYLRWMCTGRALHLAEFCCCAPLKLGVLQEGAFGPWVQRQPGTYCRAGLGWPGAGARLTSGL